METSIKKRSKSYYARKEKYKQMLDFYKVKNKAELKVKLEEKRRRKFSNSRYQRGNRRIANWWRIARVNKARQIARKLSRLQVSDREPKVTSTVTFAPIEQGEPTIQLVNGKFKYLKTTELPYRLLSIDIPIQENYKEQLDKLCEQDPRRRLFYKQPKRIITLQEYVHRFTR
jgi:hypothetical protein